MKRFAFDNQYIIDSGGLNGETSTLIMDFHFLFVTRKTMMSSHDVRRALRVLQVHE